MKASDVSARTVHRLPRYRQYLLTLRGEENVSAARIAGALSLGEVQVRKDLAKVSQAGHPKTGYRVQELLSDLDAYLGKPMRSAVLIGRGKICKSLVEELLLEDYGVRIEAAFGNEEDGLLPAEGMRAFCQDNGIRLGVLIAPAEDAEALFAALKEAGVEAVWNLSGAYLRSDSRVYVNEPLFAGSAAEVLAFLQQKDALQGE